MGFRGFEMRGSRIGRFRAAEDKPSTLNPTPKP